jgi:hypothetical protein
MRSTSSTPLTVFTDLITFSRCSVARLDWRRASAASRQLELAALSPTLGAGWHRERAAAPQTRHG